MSCFHRCPSLNQESFMHQETSMSNWRTAMLLTSFWYSSISHIPCSSAGRRISGFRLCARGITKRRDSSTRSCCGGLTRPRLIVRRAAAMLPSLCINLL
ncbi:hypothetical protein MUK42_37676 [Musa troglodytarum]|uniref:Uncharacterized protein n=1 Tax=Musa troglodytarum TaxID=320322 RepID=A0A9E7ED31_9LILI|nr:hypothetical protein MUK42_37676 [Musa troglodytarum]